MIGTLATGAGMPVDVVTGDRDLFQLVDDSADVRILYIGKGVGRHERVTESWVEEKYAVTAAQYADFAAMRGDASDGLPGVAGRRARRRPPPCSSASATSTASSPPRRTPTPTWVRGHEASSRRPSTTSRWRPPSCAVARDIDLDRSDLTLPRVPADPDRVLALAEQWGLESPPSAS